MFQFRRTFNQTAAHRPWTETKTARLILLRAIRSILHLASLQHQRSIQVSTRTRALFQMTHVPLNRRLLVRPKIQSQPQLHHKPLPRYQLLCLFQALRQ